MCSIRFNRHKKSYEYTIELVSYLLLLMLLVFPSSFYLPLPPLLRCCCCSAATELEQRRGAHSHASCGYLLPVACLLFACLFALTNLLALLHRLCSVLLLHLLCPLFLTGIIVVFVCASRFCIGLLALVSASTKALYQ